MRQVKAFTIIELLVAMVIGALVTGFAYYGYDVAWKLFQQYRKNEKVINQLGQLRVALESDFLHARSIDTRENGIRIVTQEGRLADYAFYSTGVVYVSNNVTDSFKVAVTYYEPRYNAVKCQLPGLLVDELYLETEITGEQEKYHFLKRYSAAEHMLKEEEINGTDQSVKL